MTALVDAAPPVGYILKSDNLLRHAVEVALILLPSDPDGAAEVLVAALEDSLVFAPAEQ